MTNSEMDALTVGQVIVSPSGRFRTVIEVVRKVVGSP